MCLCVHVNTSRLFCRFSFGSMEGIPNATTSAKWQGILNGKSSWPWLHESQNMFHFPSRAASCIDVRVWVWTYWHAASWFACMHQLHAPETLALRHQFVKRNLHRLMRLIHFCFCDHFLSLLHGNLPPEVIEHN